jgi:branched-chain amino acid transport system ATP-binding protein
MLEVSDLHVSYGPVHAVRGISFHAVPGGVTLMLGPNGAGKTTSLRAVAGLIRPKSGLIALAGQPISGLRAHHIVSRGLALVPQGRQIFGSLTVLENLRMGAYRTRRQQSAPMLTEIFTLFPVLSDRRDTQAGLLSGGEQQMLAFGRALMSCPKILLLDEPSMGLAPVMVDVVLAQVRLIADRGIGVILVEQNADAAFDIADEVVVVARGERVYAGSTQEARKQLSLVRTFLGDSSVGTRKHPST